LRQAAADIAAGLFTTSGFFGEVCFPLCNARASNRIAAAFYQSPTNGESDEKHVMVTVSQRRSQLPASAAHSLAGVAEEAKGSGRFRQTGRDAALGHEARRAWNLPLGHCAFRAAFSKSAKGDIGLNAKRMRII
jgi:hypothetical protein